MLRAMFALVLSGILVTTQNGAELARESWRDDGNVISSDVSAKGQKATLAIDRKKRNLHIDQNGQAADVPIPDGSAALMNLHWAAYSVLAETYKDAAKPTPFKALLGPGRAIDATVTVTRAASGTREVTVLVGPLDVHATVDKSGAVTHASVPSQGIDVKPAGAATPLVKRAPPAGVVEEPFSMDNRGAKIAGVLWLPAKREKAVPVVIVIAGSGPVDRDGNAGGTMRTDSYRLLAEALAKQGVATIRYDKRGVGESTYSGKLEELGFDDFVNDAAALVTMARINNKLAGVYIFGHSEGALAALKLAAMTPVEGIISAAGPGRPVGELLREQLSRQLPPDEMHEFDALMVALKAGKPVQPTSDSLQLLFPPQMTKFERGMLLPDPRPLAKIFRGKLTVLQGDNDAQVTVEHDARPLAASHAGAKLVVLKDVAHTLKRDAHKGTDQPSYRDPSLPIDPGVVEAVVSTIR
ncbi:MAG: alpha/beta fold family hydrolase [bacterium]|nr:alpha/beta fold family hydrolase [bacterium]